MSWVIDGLVLLFILLWARTGWRRGFVTELATLVGLVVGIFLAYKFSPSLSAKYAWTDNPFVNQAIFFAVIFIVVYLAAQIFGEWLSKFFRFGMIDRILGLLVSVLEGLVFTGAVGYAAERFPQGAELVEGTRLFAWITHQFTGLFGGMFS